MPFKNSIIWAYFSAQQYRNPLLAIAHWWVMGKGELGSSSFGSWTGLKLKALQDVWGELYLTHSS